MQKVGIIGHFAFGHKAANGQTIKTKILAESLEKEFSEKQVLKIDTYGGIKALIKSPIQVLSALKKAQNVVILPAHNGVRIFGRLLPLFKKFFKNRKIHYVVIGGWLPKLLKSKKQLTNALKKFDGIYVETNTMKNALAAQGFQNIIVMPNCKELNILSSDELVYSQEAPYKLCIFSRVSKEKGVEDAVNVIKTINEKEGKVLFTLDIYGQVDSGQEEWFENLKSNFPHYINYGGVIQFDKSVEVLKTHFALLFPTRFYTEGIPGTIIDAYAAGLPVISAQWESCSDIVNEKTGYTYEMGNNEQLTDILYQVASDPEMILNKKTQCLNEAEAYKTTTVIKILTEKM